MGYLSIYTVYKYPKDYPDNFVVRRYEITPNGTFPDDNAHSITKNLEEARLTIPNGLIQLNRDWDDEPCIVETWI